MNLRRKRLRLMRDTQWRGYARTAEGNPITLSQIRSVLSLSVLGNSSQDGTPSPDNPVDVVGTGVRTGNLFDAEKFKELCLKNVAGTIIDSIDGRECIVGYSSNFHDNFTGDKYSGLLDNIDNDTQYTISIAVKALSEDNTGIVIGFIYTDGTHKTKLYSKISNTYFEAFTLTSDSGKIIKTISFSYDIRRKIAVDISAFLVEGAYTADTLPPYEPYGYKVAVTAQGRNLWDRNFSDNDDNWVGNKGGYRYLNIELKPNTKYTLFVKQNNMHKGYSDYWDKKEVAFYLGEIANNWYGNVIFGNTTANNGIKTLYSFETTDVPYYFNLYISQSSTITVKEVFDELLPGIMLVEGKYTAESLPPYEPYRPPQSFNIYMPEPLHGVGDAHDTVVLDFDRHKAELVQKVNKIIMTGNESIQVYEYPQKPSYNGFSSFTLLNGKKYSREKYFSNHFGFSGSNILWIGVANYVIYFINSQFYNAEFEDKGLSNFVAFLKQQYDSGNPVTIYYDNSRYEPTTTDITALQQWDKLPQLRGTWILTASGGTEPTLKAEYYSEERSTE